MSDRLNAQSQFTRLSASSIDAVASQLLDQVIEDQKGEERQGALFIEQVAFAQCFLRQEVQDRIGAFFQSRS
ncbi:MAG: hypothetical protein ACKOB3_00165 [Holophagaceae bacterium]